MVLLLKYLYPGNCLSARQEHCWASQKLPGVPVNGPFPSIALYWLLNKQARGDLMIGPI